MAALPFPISIALLAATTACCHALTSPSLTHGGSSGRLLLSTRHRSSGVPSSSSSSSSSFISHHSNPSRRRNAFRTRPRGTRPSVAAALSGNNDDDDGERHLRGIGVGIDLGTTNSAVAMMIPAAGGDYGDGRGRTVPAMIEVDEDGRTIPSVVAFVPADDELTTTLNSHDLSLPPWTDPTTGELAITSLGGVDWPHIDTADAANDNNELYQIHIGKRAIQYEQNHPESTFRNVKRIIGTGGRMAQLATGVVPNLFIQSINGKASEISGGGSGDSLDELFNFLEDGDGNKKSRKKNKKGKNKKGNKNAGNKSKWQKKKQAELPKLHKQLEDATEDPALLTCRMNGDGDDDDESSKVLLRPEQISACILRKLYDTAENYHRSRNNDDDDSSDADDEDEVRVTRAVIGVPAYFTEAQRRATVRASELAGVSKVKLLPEPEAAALAYGSASSSAKNKSNDVNGYDDTEELILVFDLGGGTFDVSILEVGGGVTEVLATVGNNRLGGTDFDRRVAEYLSAQAVEIGRNINSKKRRMEKENESLDGLEDDANGSSEDSKRREKRELVVKDWYRQGSGEVPDIILRVAEEVRKALSNQRVVEVLLPLTEDAWRQVGGDDFLSNNIIITPSFDEFALENQYSMIEGEDYAIASMDRKIFESICDNELQLLLQPIREVAVMAGVLLPGEARPSIAENAIAMQKEREMFENDGEDFWEFENDEDDDMFEDERMLIKTGKDGISIDTNGKDPSAPKEEVLNEQALEQIQAMDIKAQKKAQQRGRRNARSIDKKERSYRKQKQSAMEEANTASMLGLQPGGKKGKRGGNINDAAAAMSQSSSTKVSVGNERVQDGIHGRPLTRIVLVGGATRMPVIAKLLEAVVGMVPQKTVHPDEAVALGCAVQAGILDGDNEGLLGGMQAVLSPMQAAVMRALAKKRGMEVNEGGELSMMGDGGDNEEMMMMGGISGMMVVDGFDDEDDFY